MSTLAFLDGLPEVRGAVSTDPTAHAVEDARGEAGPLRRDAEAAAAAAAHLSAAGAALRLARLELLQVAGLKKTTLTALKPDELVLVSVDPTRRAAGVERALLAWTRPPGQAEAAAGEASIAATPRPEPAPAPPASPAAAPDAPDAPLPADPWAQLRRAIVRGQLTEAARLRDLGQPPPGGRSRPGAEPLRAAERDRALRALLEGVGSVLAGDAVSGARSLDELTTSAQPNLSLRWLGTFWSARAALKGGQFPVARAQIREALTLAQQLDILARAASQWTAAEVLARQGDPTRGIAWLREARARFARLQDAWGLARTWLTEAHLVVGAQGSKQDATQEAEEAARQARAADPAWDEPALFLARAALLRGDLAGAEVLLAAVATPAADRVRAVMTAIRHGKVTQADAGEYLREQDEPPSARGVRALERIADAAPRFLLARESLAWMLLKMGRYPQASEIFRWLLGQDLSPGDRASAMLGLSCISNAQAGAARGGALRSALSAGGAGPGEPPAPTPNPALTNSALSRAATDAVFAGQLSAFALPDLLEYLRSARRSGLLVCSSASGLAALQLRDGWITGAAAPGAPRLGDLLLRDHKVTRLVLSAFDAENMETTSEGLADRLVSEDIVGRAGVEEALREQAEAAVAEALRFTGGEFAFRRAEEGERPRSAKVRVDPQAVLLRLFQRQDESGREAPEGATPSAT